MELLLPTLLAHVNSLTTNVEDIECSMVNTLSALERANSLLECQQKTIDDLRQVISQRASTPPIIDSSAIAQATLDAVLPILTPPIIDSSAVAQATLDVVLPILQQEMQSLRTYLNGVVDRIAFADAIELPDSSERNLKTVGTSTYDMPIPPIPERRLVSTAVQTEAGGSTVGPVTLPLDGSSDAGLPANFDGDTVAGCREEYHDVQIGSVDHGAPSDTEKYDVGQEVGSDEVMAIDETGDS